MDLSTFTVLIKLISENLFLWSQRINHIKLKNKLEDGLMNNIKGLCSAWWTMGKIGKKFKKLLPLDQAPKLDHTLKSFLISYRKAQRGINPKKRTKIKIKPNRTKVRLIKTHLLKTIQWKESYNKKIQFILQWNWLH